MNEAYYTARKWYGKGAEDFISAEDAHHFTKDDVNNQFDEFYSREFPQVIDHQGPGYQDRYEFKLPDGKKIAVGRLSTDFFEKIRALPTPTKLEMMNISMIEIQCVLDEQKATLINALEIIFKSKWLDKIDDIPIDWMDAKANNDRFELPYGSKALLAHFRAGRLNVLIFADQIFRFVREECKPVPAKRSVEHSKVLGALGLI